MKLMYLIEKQSVWQLTSWKVAVVEKERPTMVAKAAYWRRI